MRLIITIAALLTLVVITPARASNTYIAGDSLCVGITMVTGLKSVAKNGATIKDAIKQLAVLPAGSTIILCNGTNDAVAGLRGYEADVKKLLRIVEEKQFKLTWIGPPTLPRSDLLAAKADKIIAALSPRYVSLRAVQWQQGERAGDRIHFTLRGYRRIARLAGVLK